MSKKNIKIYYCYPVQRVENKLKLVNLIPVMEELKLLAPEQRVVKESDGNLQLKKIEYDKKQKRWYLSFLRNRTDAPFKTKLDDNTETAEMLADNEFVGQECCAIYDEESKIIALQNNRSSISFNGLNRFLINYMKDEMYLSIISYKDKYCKISEENLINYKSVIIGYTDISEFMNLANENNDKAIRHISKLANDLSAVSGKIELSVGREKSFLKKSKLKKIVEFFISNPHITNTLKVKMVEGNDGVRLIDLLNNKVNDEIEIVVTKDQPKTFTKILNAMNIKFDEALEETFEKCKMFTET